MKKLILILALGFGLFTACKKGTLVENTTYEKLEIGSNKYAYLKLLNLSPGSPVVNFYVNGTKFSAGYSTSGLETGGFAYNGLFPSFGYANTISGSQTLSAKTLAGASTDPNLEVFSTNINPEGGKYYSIITNGLYNTSTKQIPSYKMIEDVRPATDTTKVFIRLLNLYGGGPALDMLQDVTNEKIVSAVPSGEVSDWVTIPKPGQTNKYLLKDANTQETLGTLTATLTKGRAYTIYTRGISGDSSFPFAVTFYTTFYSTIN
ncbi:MAG: DUF4397 domain-containing protein [Sphingobacteriales bacterium]|nr:DUF4397 domain-containing protein [Sphingobacteriales bacterium]